jgi:hypothetical protein
MYAPGEYNHDQGVEQVVFWMMPDAHFFQRLEERIVSFDKTNGLAE